MVEECVVSHSIFNLSILNGNIDLVLQKKDDVKVGSFLNFISDQGFTALDPKIGALISKERIFFTELSRRDIEEKIEGRKPILLHEITRIT